MQTMGRLGGDNPINTIETPIFVVRSYSWNEMDDNVPESEFTLNKHNNAWHFWHKPSGIKICWYKYPLRDAYSNYPLTSEQLYDILYDCDNSLHPKVIHWYDCWWEEKDQ